LGGRDTGGMNVYIRELSKALGELGHTVDIYTRAHDPCDRQVEDIAKNVHLVHIRAGCVEDMAKTAQYSHLSTFTANLEDFRERNLLEYDLIHSHYWLSGKVGSALSKIWQVPDVMMYHTVGAVKNALNIGGGETACRIQTERRVAKNCVRIITATQREKRDINSCYNVPLDKIGIVPCGVNLNLFRHINRQNARHNLNLNGNATVLYVGRIDPLKGIDKLIKAVALLSNEHPLELIIIGGDNYSHGEINRLKKLAQALGIDGRVSFLGSVPQGQLPLYYSAANLCVVPSYYETFGMVSLEALACGTPVVTTDTGAANSLVKDGLSGYIAADNNPATLAKKIATTLKERLGRDENRLAIRNSVAQYNWADIAEQITIQYQTVMKQDEAKLTVG